MSVEEVDVVDAIGVEVSSGKVVMTISDHLSWEAEPHHISLLKEKLNSYLRFFESGELLTAYPAAAGKDIAIDIVFRLPLSKSALAFLDNAKAAVASTGIELRYRQIHEES